MDIVDLARSVAARYSGDVEGDDNLPWMEHVQKAQESDLNLGGFRKTISDAALPEGAQPHIHDDSTGKALIDDISGGLSVPREMDGPAVNVPEESTGTGEPVTHFNTPDHYKDTESLKHWWEAKERSEENTGTPFGKEQELTGMTLEASRGRRVLASSGSYFGFTKEAKTLTQILYDNKNHKKQVMDERGSKLSPVLSSTPEQKDSGLYLYKVQSPGSYDTWTTAIQFLRRPGEEKKRLIDHDCLVGCTCPAFLYWGAQYYAMAGNYMYMDMFRPTLVSPKDYIPKVTKGITRGQHGTYCKHLFAAIHAVSRLTDVMPKTLSETTIHLTEPVVDTESLFETMHIQTREDFLHAVSSGKVPEPLKEDVTTLLNGKHSDSEEFTQRFLPLWVSSTNAKALAWKIDFVSGMLQAPSLVMWLLIQEKRKNGTVPAKLLEAAWVAISKQLEIK